MSILRATVAALLAMSATLASAQGAPSSLEERLQRLEAEQAAMKQQLAERDAVIQELRRELQAEGSASAVPVPTPVPAAPDAAAAAVAGTPTIPAPETRQPTPREVETWSVYDPGTGYLVGRTKRGELAISAYAMARYMNQNDDDQVFTDHLGNERPVDPRNDIFSHRIMVVPQGLDGQPKLVYNITFWTVNTTDQDAIFANLGYQFSKKFSLYAGLAGNPGSRSLIGSHPYWLGHDRVMADEFFRPYFGSGIYATGEALPGLWYNATRLEQQQRARRQGEPARSQVELRRHRSGGCRRRTSSARAAPTATGRCTTSVATRFGVSCTRARSRASADSPAATPRTPRCASPTASTCSRPARSRPASRSTTADYRVLAVDAGVKYKGIFVQAEYYQRWLDDFVADGPLPVGEIKDNGFYVQAAFFPIPQKLELYGITSQIYGDEDAGFGDSSEYGVGMNWYPFRRATTASTCRCSTSTSRRSAAPSATTPAARTARRWRRRSRSSSRRSDGRGAIHARLSARWPCCNQSHALAWRRQSLPRSAFALSPAALARKIARSRRRRTCSTTPTST